MVPPSVNIDHCKTWGANKKMYNRRYVRWHTIWYEFDLNAPNQLYDNICPFKSGSDPRAYGLFNIKSNKGFVIEII